MARRGRPREAGDAGAALISRVLLRAPALPAIADGRDDAARRQLVDNALALARDAGDDAAVDADARSNEARALPSRPLGLALSLARYRARMAFRPTPAGLFAGVCMGTLGARTRIASGGAGHAHLSLRFDRLASLCRALLDEPALRRRTRLRQSPSLLRDGVDLMWLTAQAPWAVASGASPAAPQARVERTTIDALLGAALEATGEWTAWSKVARAVAATADMDPTQVDEYLLLLVDGGLLHSDLAPSLIGPPATEQLRARLLSVARVPLARAVLETLAAVEALLTDGAGHARPSDDPGLAARISEARRLVAALPAMEARAESIAAVLELRPEPASAVLSRGAVARAASLGPLLFRLLSTFSPTWERATSPALDRTLRTLIEEHGPGGFDPSGLVFGRYAALLGPAAPSTIGVDFPLPPAIDEHDRGALPPAAIVRFLVERLLLCPPGEELRLRSEELAPLVPEADVPPTFELVVSPCVERDGEPDGTGWLLGLHGPAGSTWGRFAHALGAPLAEAFDELFSVEKSAGAGAGHEAIRGVDLEYAPGAEVADVASHPSLRGATLALTGWPAAGEVLRPADLQLVLGASLYAEGASGAPAALGLRQRTSGHALRLSPLSRIRSTTVEEDGLYRLLAGFALQRASFPWALHLGPLGSLWRLPRISLDGFVIMPASCGIPAELLAALHSMDADDMDPGKQADDARAALCSMATRAGLPRLVQAGEGDQMLPIDLEDPDEAARAQLRRLPAGARLWEVWPPLDRLADRDGRRVEAVVAVVASGARTAISGIEPSDAPALDAEDPSSSEVSPAAAPRWMSYRLFGAPARADRVLVDGVRQLVDEARQAGEIDGWFFLRYVDEEQRHHLRLRLRCASRIGTRSDGEGGPGGDDPFAAEDPIAVVDRRVRRALAPFVDDGELSAIERGGYRPELVRYGGARAMRLVERAFESDSALALDLIAADPDLRSDGVVLVVRSYDALARGLGLDLPARLALAGSLRAAHADTLALLAPTSGVESKDALAPLYRLRQAALLQALERDAAEPGGGEHPERADEAEAPLRAHRLRLSDVAGAFAREQLSASIPTILPSLLHLATVRLVGTGVVPEAIASYLWERSLHSLSSRGRAPDRRLARRGGRGAGGNSDERNDNGGQLAGGPEPRTTRHTMTRRREDDLE